MQGEEISQQPLHPKQQQILNTGTTQQIAQLIADTPTYKQSSLLLQHIKTTDTQKCEEVIKELKSMLVVNPQVIYVSDSYLTIDRLSLIADLFGLESDVDQNYFKNQNVYVLMAVTRGYLRQELAADKVAKLKQLFAKNIKKQSSFWGLGHLQALNNYICDPSTGYLSAFSSSQHSNEIARFEYFFAFVQEYPNLFPPAVDLWSVVLKIMGCLREQRQKDRKLLARLKAYYFGGKYHYQTTLKNMKFILQFFRNSFNQKQCLYYPQRAFNSVLEPYTEDQLVNLLEGSWLGLQWFSSTIHNYFIACIKLGITEQTSKMLMAIIRFCLKHNKYNELIYTYENNMARLFIFLKYPKLFGLTSRLMKHFIYAPTPQIPLYQKFTEKAIPLVQSISKQILVPFLQMMQIVAFKYKETTVTNDLTSVVESLQPNQTTSLTEQKIKEELEKYSWKAQIKAKQMSTLERQQPGLRGLTNIGNSCYLNSFLQSLFMNPQFLRSIISVSTLQLEKQKQQANKDKKDMVALSKNIREDLRPLAELQRLFALLLCSKRSQVSPLPIRNISPTEFRNNHQHDTLEFGRLFLDLLYKNNIPKLFQGEQTTIIQCDGCHKVRERKEVFLDLIVSPQKEGEELEETIAHSFQEEIISDLICDHCQERRDKSVKRHKVSKCPPYLIVSIKRFQYNPQQQKNSKIMTKIQINPHIIISQQHYDLYSIIVHRGPSPNAGHYFAFSRLNLLKDSKWVCHNDAEVSELESYADVQQFMQTNESDTPYILFYANRRHVEEKGEELTKPIVLRKPLEDYVQKDFMEMQKSKEKKVLQVFKPFNFPFFKPDDDDEGGPQNPSFFNNNYIV